MFVFPLAHSGLRAHRPTFRRLDSAPALAQVIDRLFDDGQRQAPDAATRMPALDVDETNTHYLLRFDVPGASKEVLTVSIAGRRVRIETLADQSATASVGAETNTTDPVVQDAAATPSPTAEAESPRSLYRERSNVRYARTVSLPQEVDSDASQAKLDNGVLTLRLAKRRADGARHLAVN